MMGLRVKKEALDAIIAEVDEDGKKFFFTFYKMLKTLKKVFALRSNYLQI